MKKILLLSLMLALLLPLSGYSQGRVVTGKVVTAADAMPLPGVSVVVKGTTTGTATDADGNFSLNVPEGNNVLVFRFIGYRTMERTVGNESVINVALQEDTRQLEEVVVTAIGIERETKALGYSVQEVGTEELARSTQPSIANAINGKVAGVNITSSSGAPGAGQRIVIRGATSVTGNNQPLFVIDGVPIDNSTTAAGNPNQGTNAVLSGVANSNRAVDINPEDIESVTVLKGPAATALYGIRAGSGAIVITTKKGKEGRAVINYNTSFTLDYVNKLPELQQRYSQGSDGEFTGTFSGFNSVLSWGAPLDQLRFDGQPYPYDPNGFLVPADSSAATDQRAIAYDNLDNFFETGKTWTNTLSISGGTEKAEYYVSLGHTDQEGVVPKSDFQRTSVRVTGSTQLNDKFRTFGSANYIKSGGRRVQQGSNISGVMLGLLRAPITFDLSGGFGEEGDENPGAYVFEDGTQRTYREGAGYDNPFWTVNRNPFEDDVNRLIGYVGAQYDFTDWVNASFRLGTDWYSDRRTGGFDIQSRAFPEGQVYEDQVFNRDINTDLLVTFDREVTTDVSARLILGHNYFNSRFQRLYTQGDGLAVPTFFDLANAASITTTENTIRIERAAVYADLSLDYKNFIFLGFTGRNEWSSTLPTDNQSFFYPSINLGFVFTEAFDLTGDVFDFGKVRASYAVVGKDAPAYALTTPFASSTWGDGWTNGIFFPFQGVAGFNQVTQLGNPDIKPEKNKSIEFGVDLRFFDNRLGLDATYYKNNSEDQIIPVSISSASGFLSAVLNSGEIENKGIEAVLRGTPVQTTNFSWDVIVNFTRNQSEVISLYPGVETITLNGFTSPSSRAIVGEPYGVLFGGRWARNDQGQLLIGNDGFPFPADEDGVIGDPNPDWTAGITNTITWKGLSLSALLDIREGGDIWNGTIGVMNFFGTSKNTENRGETKVFEGVRVDDGTPNTQEVVLDQDWYQANGGGFGAVEEQFVEDGSWVRLRELTLSYNLPATLLEKTPVKAASIAFNARNLWLNTDYSGIDPENNLTGQGNALGLDYFSMPNTEGYGLTLRVTF
ncbi:SusC/RagA family TonB-linked outer membrane protein [Pontibacter anaerobius]|uniref:SusC/RagA family TonB-linked outer membrane protein n=1 Tax=Pontibacter anaerobius TaxID=2993940 RepID=A0ABT3RDN5_9BACT|nr:SusC/RagA family TonB-linked outer membrane protein [Pontibacter anaerobius]MCX2739621.1 SusC/RagA family TonB-linked outer membrane protein [Pontibacter anaerobius]